MGADGCCRLERPQYGYRCRQRAVAGSILEEGSAPQVNGIARLRGFGRRHRVVVAVAGATLTAGALGVVLAGRRHEFAVAISSAAWWVLALTVALHVGALLSRAQAWHLTIEAAGGRVA